MSKSNYLENKLLDHRLGGPDFTRPATVYAALYVGDPGEAGAGGAESAYTGYARVSITNNSTAFPAASSGQKSNGVVISFPACTGGTSNVTHFAIFDASTGGNMLDYGPLGGAALVFTATVADALTVPGHSLVVDDTVVIESLVVGTLPGGVTQGTTYYVKTVTGNDITLSATQGGATLDITSAGAGMIRKLQGLAISNGITPQIAIGQMVIVED